MYSDTYQLVSEHSILSAQRKNRNAAGAPTSQRLETFGECVRQIGATRKPYRGHDVNATARSNFKVYDRGREKLEDTNSRRRSRENEIERHWNRKRPGETRRSRRRGEFLEKLEEIAEVLRSYISNVVVNSSTPDERRETEELKKEHDEIEGGEPGNVIVKIEGDEIGGDVEPPLEQSKIEAPREEDPPSETLEGGAILTEVSPLIDLGEITISCVTTLCDGEVEEEQSCGDDHATVTVTVTAPSEENDAATVEGKWLLARDGGEKILSQSVETKGTSVEWGSMQLDPAVISLGQAQVKVSRPDSFDIKREVSKEKGEVLIEKAEKENKLFRFSWSQKKLDITFNPMGQSHNFIITPTLFTKTEGVFQVEKAIDQKKLIGFDWAQNPYLSMNFQTDANVFGLVGAPKIEGDVLATVVSFRENREATTLYDPGGGFMVSCITWSSYFKLWDPGGRLLTVRFRYLHLEDKVNV